MNKCHKCQYEWKGMVEIPKQCPRCKRYDWETKRGDTNEETNKSEQR